MSKIGLFYGSDTGNTEDVANMVADLLGESTVELFDIYNAKKEELASYNQIIIGLSTWHDGQLQSDWDAFFADFQEIDFSGKTVALFGLGDQYGYSSYFIDGVGILGDVILENGGTIIGKWSAEDYEHDESKAEKEEGVFLGLAIDEDNQSELTEERVEAWVEQITEEFGLNA